jgi:hypothetical protein
MISKYYRDSETFSHQLDLFFEARQDRSLSAANVSFMLLFDESGGTICAR